MDRLKDKVALVTGGSKGIGAGISRRFAEEGAITIIASRRVEESQALADELAKEGWRTDAHRLDISSLDEWRTIIDYIIDKYGRIDVLMNNAGVATTGAPMDTMDLARDWDMLIDCNLTGTFYGMYTVVPKMIETGGGSIVNTSSYGASVACTGVSGYVAAKAGIIALSRDIAAAYGSANIRCNTVSPGATMTPAVEPLLETMPDVMDGLISNCVIHRFGTPEDIGNACVFLASDESSYITGQDILVDGGYTIV